MDINHLRYVAAIAQTRSFSRAAEQLYISQSSLSQIGYPLFLRTTKRVQLSPEGTRFLAQAQRVLHEFEALEAQILAVRSSLEHAVNLGVSMIYRPDTSALIARFIREHQEIDFNLVSAWELEIVEMLHSGRIDMGLFGVDWENDDLSGLTVLPLRDEHVVAVVSEHDPLSQKKAVQLEDLADAPLIFTSERSAVRRLVLQKFRQQGIIPAKITEINETETRMHCVRQGLGVALGMNTTHHWIGYKGICRIPLEPALVRTYSLVLPNESIARHSAAIQLLQNFLLDNLRRTACRGTKEPDAPDVQE